MALRSTGRVPLRSPALTLLTATAVALATSAAGCSPADTPAPVESSSTASTVGTGLQTGVPVAEAGAITRQEWLAPQWSGEGPAPSPLPVIRELGKEEQHLAWVTCVEEAGFPNTSTVEGQGEFVVPTEQGQEFEIASYQCHAQYPLAPKYYQPYSAGQLAALYEYQIGELTRCIVGQDPSFAPDTPPSLEKFTSDWRGDVTPRWFPYDNVPQHARADVERLCPLESEGVFDLAVVPEE